MKKICHITTVHPPFDTRIFHKECKTAVNAGYDVVLIAHHDKNEVVDGIKIFALPKAKNRFHRMLIISSKALWLSLKQKADIYHFHDPEFILSGMVLKIFGKKVIYDMHELVYFQIDNKYWIKNKILKIFIKTFYFLCERITAWLFDYIIFTEDDYKNYWMSTHGIGNFTVIKNYPVIRYIDIVRSGNDDKNMSKKNIIIYAGGLGSFRGVREIIQSMGKIQPGSELWLLGKWENKQFLQECKKLSSWQYTKYMGFMLLPDVYRYMKMADIGISVLHPIRNYITSLPVKAFEYMACGLPMVMSDFPYWREMFSECAVFANPNDPQDIADKIKYLLENPEIAIKLAKKGRFLIETRYNWEIESKRLIELYEKLF